MTREWHVDRRAFDISRPSARASRNVAFDQSLRPAIGIRDGLEPNSSFKPRTPKLRLTQHRSEPSHHRVIPAATRASPTLSSTFAFSLPRASSAASLTPSSPSSDPGVHFHSIDAAVSDSPSVLHERRAEESGAVAILEQGRMRVDCPRDSKHLDSSSLLHEDRAGEAHVVADAAASRAHERGRRTLRPVLALTLRCRCAQRDADEPCAMSSVRGCLRFSLRTKIFSSNAAACPPTPLEADTARTPSARSCCLCALRLEHRRRRQTRRLSASTLPNPLTPSHPPLHSRNRSMTCAYPLSAVSSTTLAFFSST
ncbi:hypothetical protein MSAN_00440600 [Mycena sanguinolenta]|uniref:Uncharacterized protein n=1 Tax=Mycena sanguinolenta TaxID=230812 RepID=A0A8H6ZDK3_9AGAR|nr:hypothetical protein MSAN_00440600 [Mycena sanguinolenta]